VTILARRLPAIDVRAWRDGVLALLAHGGALRLVQLDRRLETEDEIAQIRGANGRLLDVPETFPILAAVDNKVVSIGRSHVSTLLVLPRNGNIMLRATRGGDALFAAEYGESPTGVWVADKTGSRWRRLITNREIDPDSRHFHDLAFDPSRGWLLTTLGDGNLVRVAISPDDGMTWKPLLEGPWQFFPILVDGERIVFGMDSGIARGGVGVHRPQDGNWETIFLRWTPPSAGPMQMSFLGKMRSALYVAGTFSPPSIIASEDLRYWHLVHPTNDPAVWGQQVSGEVNGGFFVFCTGSEIGLVDEEGLHAQILETGPVAIQEFNALARLRGYAFVAKRLIRNRLRRRLVPRFRGIEQGAGRFVS